MKLTLRFLTLVVALLIAVGISEQQGVNALNRLGTALERVVDSDMERVFAITHVRRLFRSMIVLEGDYLLATKDSERQSMDKKMASLAKEQLEQIEKYARLMPSEDKKAIADIRAVRERWIERDKRVRALAATDHAQALALSKEHARDPVNWEKVIGSLVKLSETRLSNQVTETKRIHANAKRNLQWVALGATTVALGLGFVIFLGIRRNIREVLTVNANLERLVAERTEALARREHSLRLVLNSTGDAFVELDREGRLSGETSAATIRWFGDYELGQLGSAYLFRGDRERQKSFDVAFSQLVDDVLPWELTAEQMPKRIEVGEAILELEYRQVLEDGNLKKILIVARDVSARVHSEIAERNAREQQAVIGKLLADKTGFAQFVSDCETLITSLANESDPLMVKRNLHTLKGNTAVYGMTSMADYCHRLEDQLASNEEPLQVSKLADLAALWRSKLQGIEGFLAGIGENILQIDNEEHQRLIDSLMHRRDYQEILSMVEVWSWSRASDRLTRLRAQTEYIAKRLGKNVHVVVDPHDVRTPNEYLNRFWPSLIHVIRNAVDHGIESLDERTLAGKPPRATIEMSTFEEDNELIVQIRDDGRGIDNQKVLGIAQARGIICDSSTSLLDLVTKEGVSTRAETTDLSGRGVGLYAVRHACEEEGGRIVLVNEPGRGVTFQFRFRKPVVKTGALAAKLTKRWSLLPPSGAALNSRDSQTVRLETTRKTS